MKGMLQTDLSQLNDVMPWDESEDVPSLLFRPSSSCIGMAHLILSEQMKKLQCESTDCHEQVILQTISVLLLHRRACWVFILFQYLHLGGPLDPMPG